MLSSECDLNVPTDRFSNPQNHIKLIIPISCVNNIKDVRNEKKLIIITLRKNYCTNSRINTRTLYQYILEWVFFFFCISHCHISKRIKS